MRAIVKLGIPCALVLACCGCAVAQVSVGAVDALPGPGGGEAHAQGDVEADVGFMAGFGATLGVRVRPSSTGTQLAIVPKGCVPFSIGDTELIGEGCAAMSLPWVDLAHPASGVGVSLEPAVDIDVAEVDVRSGANADDMVVFLRIAVPVGYDFSPGGAPKEFGATESGPWVGATVGFAVWYPIMRR